MKVLHVSQYCHVGSTGGTERYMLDLIQALGQGDVDGFIVWLSGRDFSGPLVVEGVSVVRLPAPAMRTDPPLPGFQEAAEQLLAKECPDWLHFHTFGLTEAKLAEMARKRGIRTAFTYHSPAWTCRRGTMLLYGREPCDGELRPWRCSACQSQERLAGSSAAAHLATAASCTFGWLSLGLGRTSVRRRTAFFQENLRFRRAARRFLSSCNLVISCAEWSLKTLQLNGARPETTVHCPQGVSQSFLALLENVPPLAGKRDTFTIGYVGRFTPVKGIHVLMEGFSMMNQHDVRLRIVGWEPHNAETPYARRIRAIAERDSRIELVHKTDQAGTVREYRRMNLLAIPSVCLETGPLTMMEAIAAGVPVYGSNRIGQIGLLREHGRVVEPNTPESWRQALAMAFDRYSLTTAAPQAVSTRKQRTMANVAAEHLTYYRSPCGSPVVAVAKASTHA